MKIEIEWKLLAKAVGIFAVIFAVIALIAILVKYAPWVLACVAGVLAVVGLYCLLLMLED